MDKIPISIPSFGVEEFEAIKKPLLSGWITQGEFVREFEERFALMHETKYAIATTSCTTALHLMLLASGIKPGDEVIVPSFTWIATANAVKYCGATPIFADIDIKTYNISIEDVVKKITPKTKAVIVVHLFGLCVDVTELRKRIPAHLEIFEDAACAAGANVRGNWAGGLGEAAAFSFHPRKSVTTGEGGMILTNREDIADLARKLRNHGAEISEEERHSGPAPYHLPEFNYVGFNYRMTDLQAAVGIEQIKKLPKFIEERNEIASRYSIGLDSCSWLEKPEVPEGFLHAWQSYVVRVKTSSDVNVRNQLMSKLESKGISTRPGTHAIHLLGAYKNEVQNSDGLVNSTNAANTTISLPMHNRLSRDQQDHVIRNLIDIEL